MTKEPVGFWYEIRLPAFLAGFGSLIAIFTEPLGLVLICWVVMTLLLWLVFKLALRKDGRAY